MEKEIIVNIAYRWFLGLDFDDDIPDHSTLSQLRRRKFKDSNLFQEIFDEVVWQCIKVGLVDGKLLLTDSTHMKANVCETKREVITVKDVPSAYMKRLDELALQEELIKETNKTSPKAKEKTKEIKVSTSDPDSGILNRPGKPNGFHYLSHNTVDGNSGIITDVHVTSGNTKDSTPHSERIQTQIEKFNFDTKEVGADATYDTGEIHSDMLRMDIKTFIPKHRQVNPNEGLFFTPKDFNYNHENNCYICPNNCILKYSTFKKGNGLKTYSASTKDCRICPLKNQCISGKGKCRSIHRPYHQAEIDIQRKNNSTERYKEIMRLRQIWCEGNNSHQKARHCLSRAKMRGIEKVTEQCLMSACVLNLTRLVKCLKRHGNTSVYSYFWSIFTDFRCFCDFKLILAV